MQNCNLKFKNFNFLLVLLVFNFLLLSFTLPVFANDEFSIGEIAGKFRDYLGSRVGTGKIDIFNLEEASISEIFSALLPYVFALAGLLLFGAIIYSGFLYLTSGGEPKKNEEAKGYLTSAVVGFLIIFLSWWLIQILQIIFHISILG